MFVPVYIKALPYMYDFRIFLPQKAQRDVFEYLILLPYRIFQHSRYNRIYTNNINIAMG
jgi:hypothetical protein